MSTASGESRPITLDALSRILLPDETVGTVSAALKPLRLRVETRRQVQRDDVVFAVEVGSEASVLAFNTITDRDPDLVLVAAGSERGGQLELTPGSCWLKIQHTAALSAEGGTGPSHRRLNLQAEAPVTFSDYRLHDPGENAVQAVMDDLRSPRFAQSLEDVRSLRPNEAVAFQATGRLRAKVEVSWSDVLASGLGALAGIVGASAPLTVELPGVATVTGTVTVGDEFTVTFSRLHDGRTRVTVTKARSRTFAGSADLGLSVELAEPEHVELAVREVVTGLIGEDYATIRGLLDKASLAELSEVEKWAAEALAARLGLGDLLHAFADLREKLRQIEGAIAEAIAELAAEKLALGFSYEYSRVARGSVLLEAVLDPESLAAYHGALCNGDLEPVIAAVLQRHAGVSLEAYLQRRSLESAHAWGFTLGIGPWAASGRHRRALARVVDEDIKGAQRVSFLGLGAYEGRWLTDVAEWTVDLRADTRHFVPSGPPRFSDLAFGFHLAWHWRQESLSEDRLDEVLDAAVLWSVFSLDQAAEVKRRFAPAVGRVAELTVQVRFDDGAFREILPNMAAGRDADFAAALGAAMPRRAGTQGRGDPARRRELYGPLWAHVLEHPEAPARALVALARQHLAKGEETQLGFLEENYLKLAPTSTFVGLARVANQNTAAAWHGFRAAASLVHEAATNDAEEGGTLEKVFPAMANLWVQSHHVRALGAFMLEAAVNAGVATAVTRTLRVNVRQAGGENAVVVAAPTA